MKQIFVLEEPVDKIMTAADLFNKVKDVLIDQTKENFLVITLNTKHQVINVHHVTIGILDASLIHPREVFRPAILDNAKAIILSHNHPSESLEPSDADKEVTKLLLAASGYLGIDILDHIIFNKTEFFSMKMQGLM